MAKKRERPLLKRFRESGEAITEARKMVIQVLESSKDHPDAIEIHIRARQLVPRISVASVYRILKRLVELDLIVAHDFGDSRTRFEVKEDQHHDHLIDLETGRVIEFSDPELEKLKRKIADRHGYHLKSHSLELYGHPK